MRPRPRVFPVIDVLDRAQAVRNAALAFAVGADGIFFYTPTITMASC